MLQKNLNPLYILQEAIGGSAARRLLKTAKKSGKSPFQLATDLSINSRYGLYTPRERKMLKAASDKVLALHGGKIAGKNGGKIAGRIPKHDYKKALESLNDDVSTPLDRGINRNNAKQLQHDLMGYKIFKDLEII